MVMSDYRNSKMDIVDVERGSRRFRTVPQPARTDGVGEALRKAFGRRPESCPEDLRTLLRRLDGKSRNPGDRSH